MTASTSVATAMLMACPIILMVPTLAEATPTYFRSTLPMMELWLGVEKNA
jgi:hypothetical protein